LTIGQQQGLTIIREEVVRVEKRRDCMQVQTREGSMHQGQRLLIAAGAYTNSLLERPLVLRPRARTILLAELPTAEAERLATMPTLIVDGVDGILFKDIYVLPPIRYPDGKIYIKLGGDDISPLIASSAAELNKWFKAGGNEGQGEALKQCLLAIIPDLDAVSYHIKPCVTTAGGHRYPYLDQLDERRFVAASGWGKSAKSSNEIGRLGALVAQEKWDDPEFSQDSFKAVYA
jgi:sarcosine oxidase